MTPDLGPRPDVRIIEEEHLAILLGDEIDALEARQAQEPHQDVENILGTIRFVRDSLMRLAAVKLGRVRSGGSDEAA
jgi:hypothetical protein